MEIDGVDNDKSLQLGKDGAGATQVVQSDSSKPEPMPSEPVSNSVNELEDTAAMTAAATAATTAVLPATDVPPPPPAVVPPIVECIEEKKKDLSPPEVLEYCQKLFDFKEVEVVKFRSWKERRNFYKKEHQRKAEQVNFH